MAAVDLNADVGEEAGAAGDDPLLEVVTSASVACGFHAGDPGVMRHTVRQAVAHQVVIGAHPSYPDRDGFGRRETGRAPDRVADDVLYQVGALDALARAEGGRVRYVKPHGALYHRMGEDQACARAMAEALRAYGDLVLLAPAGSPAVAVAEGLGVAVATEAFADRAYLPDGRLVPRGEPGAVRLDPQEVAGRARCLALEGRVTAVDGSWLALSVSSICLHGDTPGAVALARAVRRALASAGVTLRPFVVTVP